MPRDAFVLKIQRELCHQKRADKFRDFRETGPWSLMVPKTIYPQPFIQLRALITLLVLNLTARKLKAHQSGQWLVRETLPQKEILNGAKIKLNPWCTLGSLLTQLPL